MNRIKILLAETLNGKSLGRTLQNFQFQTVTLSGKGIDLGSKSNSASYYRFLDTHSTTEITFVDLNPQTDGVLSVDLEKEIPVEDESQDFLLLSNVLEHLYNYRVCVAETYRVLKKSGKLIGSVPFLYQIHADPDDFFRFTESSLRRIFEEAGYEKIEVKPLGYGAVTAGIVQFAPILKIKLLIFLAYIGAIGLDKVFVLLLGKSNHWKPSNFPLHYFFICEK